MRYSPSFLAKGLVIENVECVFVNGLPMTSVLAKDIVAEDVAVVEVYNYRGGIDYQDAQMFRRNGLACGGGPIEEAYGEKGMSLRTYRSPKEATVAYIHIW